MPAPPRSILVTGATGFIGRALVPTLMGQGWQVRQIGRLPHAVPGPSSQTIDVNTQPLHTLLSGCEVVIHLAGRAHVTQESVVDPLAAYRESNVMQTEALAQAACKAGVRRFVFISTAKVHGEDGNYSERDSPQPEDPYARSKWEAEQALTRIAQSSTMEVVIIRPPLVYGPGVKGNFKSMVTWVKRGLPLPLGAVHNLRSMVALENLVDFICLCTDANRSPRAANETFLISDTQDVSTTMLLRKIAVAYRRPSRLIPLSSWVIKALGTMSGQRAAIDRLLGTFCISAEKAQSQLGWHPVTTMDEQLRKMALHDSTA
jgi:nucleoside-diphosphate-sugar epimerase